MAGDDLSVNVIVPAPMPINKIWWKKLSGLQQKLLVTFFALYFIGNILLTFAFLIDRFYQFSLNLVSVKIGNKKMNFSNQVRVTVTRGFWYENIETIYNDKINGSQLAYATHATVAQEIWHICWIRSIRGGPFHMGSIFCLIIGMFIMYFHCFTIFLLRIIMMISAIFASVCIWFALGMEYSAAKEYDFCINSLLINNGKKQYIRSRYFEPQLYINGVSFYLMFICNFFMFLPMAAIGIYLLTKKRRNL